MSRTARQARLNRQREYNAGSRERRLAAGRPLRSDVARALLNAFLESAVRHGATPSETVVERLVADGFNPGQARLVIADMIDRRQKQSC